MKKMLEYKGYLGSVQYSRPDKVMFGEVLGIRSLLSYEGQNLDELELDFREAVEDYFEICLKHNMTPETPSFSPEQLQLSPTVLEDVVACTQSKGTTFQELVGQAVENYLEMWKKSPESV